MRAGSGAMGVRRERIKGQYAGGSGIHKRVGEEGNKRRGVKREGKGRTGVG